MLCCLCAVLCAAPPTCSYDESKRLAEALCFEFWRMHNVQIRVARIFNTYGPRMLENDGRVVSNFIVQSLTGQPITIYGDGLQTRSFCYVSDMVRALHALMNGDERGPINLGNPNEKTIAQLADAVAKTVGTAKQIVFKPVPSDDPSTDAHARVPASSQPLPFAAARLTSLVPGFSVPRCCRRRRHRQAQAGHHTRADQVGLEPDRGPGRRSQTHCRRLSRPL